MTLRCQHCGQEAETVVRHCQRCGQEMRHLPESTLAVLVEGDKCWSVRVLLNHRGQDLCLKCRKVIVARGLIPPQLTEAEIEARPFGPVAGV